jgi:hypothetical protein
LVSADPARRSAELRVIRGGLALTALAVAVQSVAYVVNVAALDNYWDALNVDSDSGGGAWASSGLQFAAAVLMLLLWARSGVDRLLLGLAAVIAFLSLDDLIQVHEHVSRLALKLHLWAHAGRLVWPAVFLPLLAASFLGLWLIAQARLEVGRLIRGGLALLVLAIVLEIAAQGLFALDVGRLDAPFVAEVILEEGAELAGWGLIVTGLATLVVAEADLSPLRVQELRMRGWPRTTTT